MPDLRVSRAWQAPHGSSTATSSHRSIDRVVSPTGVEFPLGAGGVSGGGLVPSSRDSVNLGPRLEMGAHKLYLSLRNAEFRRRSGAVIRHDLLFSM